MLFRIEKHFLSLCFSLTLILFQFSIVTLFAQLPEKSIYPKILKKAGDKFLVKSKPDSALYFYKKAFLLMKEDKFKADRAMLLTNMGNAYHYLNRVNESLECSKQSFFSLQGNS